ncbi:MAG: transposase family protein [Bacilli bacterium]|nr:transposase family protein [Bacilli bacterium]
MCYVIFSSLAGIETWEDVVEFVEDHKNFFNSFLLMSHGIPNWQTIERVISMIDSKELESILVNFFQTITFDTTPETDIINIDGRMGCESSRKKQIIVIKSLH